MPNDEGEWNFVMNPTSETKRSCKMIAIDTSTASMTTALVENGELLGERNARAERNHSMYLVPTMRELLQSLQIRPKELHAVAVGFGPGSYTGVRIGVSVAKTMAWALDIPIVNVSSLEGMALGGFDRLDGETRGATWIVPLMDARRGQVFTGLYVAGDPEGRRHESVGGLAWGCLLADGIRPMARWIEELCERLIQAGESGNGPDRIAFVGETERFAEQTDKLAAAWNGRVQVLPHDIRAYDIARLAYPRWLRGDRANVHLVAPNYTQPPEAELKLLSKLRS